MCEAGTELGKKEQSFGFLGSFSLRERRVLVLWVEWREFVGERIL